MSIGFSKAFFWGVKEIRTSEAYAHISLGTREVIMPLFSFYHTNFLMSFLLHLSFILALFTQNRTSVLLLCIIIVYSLTRAFTLNQCGINSVLDTTLRCITALLVDLRYCTGFRCVTVNYSTCHKLCSWLLFSRHEEFYV